MVAKVKSASLRGLEVIPIDVEVDVGPGLPGMTIVGLADTAVSEARERLRAAFRNANVEFPRTKITVNLAPADLKKEGTAFDLAIALGILLAQRSKNDQDFAETFVFGELGLDGSVRSVSGVLPMVRAAKQRGVIMILLPQGNVAEANLVEGIMLRPVTHLGDLIAHLADTAPLATLSSQGILSRELSATGKTAIDFAVIRGQESAKRALEIAAAGGHNILMIGPPGTGKTLLARAFSGILPSLEPDEMLEVTEIASVAGLLLNQAKLIEIRPFRSPHHSASTPAIVGGGNNVRPGEVTLAHRGVLFLDEFPEFHRDVLEALRQPLEDGVVTVSRAAGTVTYPARVTLVAAANPCPCGFADSMGEPGAPMCQCTPPMRMRYGRKLSGPILDRIDLHVSVGSLTPEQLTTLPVAESSAVVRDRIQVARQRQRARYGSLSKTNAELGPREVETVVPLTSELRDFLHGVIRQHHLSGRGYHRVLKLGRTIADLAGSETVTQDHLAEALQYRPKTVSL